MDEKEEEKEKRGTNQWVNERGDGRKRRRIGRKKKCRYKQHFSFIKNVLKGIFWKFQIILCLTKKGN